MRSHGEEYLQDSTDNASTSSARPLPKKVASASFPNGSKAEKGNKADI